MSGMSGRQDGTLANDPNWSGKERSAEEIYIRAVEEEKKKAAGGNEVREEAREAEHHDGSKRDAKE